MQPACRGAPARPQAPPCGRARTTCGQATRRGRAWCVAVAPAPRLRVRVGARASCGDGGTTTEPVDVHVPKDGEEAERAPEELEVLEEEAIAGEDEGRRPTDYDRRAHIFEESSRVFRELKQRRDGGAESGRGGVARPDPGATATETTACERESSLDETPRCTETTDSDLYG